MPLHLVRFKLYDAWFSGLPVEVAAEIAELVEYLREHGRGAALPAVRHRIQQSKHYPDMCEIRDEREVGGVHYVTRILACFVKDDTAVLLCLGGNKRTFEKEHQRDWYDVFVPIADRIVDGYKSRR
ncbi:MAG: type II toxin-antitoxin system RelE/ParE family toxin [Actinomycetota bacterium]|jgi:hypothetical protein|nr:type II toxin-antitoxin system RelE/ParE family toxin [Actinomycetota bacterium]